MMFKPFALKFIFLSIILGSFSVCHAVDHSLLMDLKEWAEPYSKMTEGEYLHALGNKKNRIHAIKRRFREFMISTDVQAPDPSTALEWSDALKSPLIQQLSLEWIARTLAEAEQKILKGTSDEESPTERVLRESQAQREMITKLTDAVSKNQMPPADAIAFANGKSALPPEKLSKTCEPVIKAVRLLGHLAPETFRETIGIETTQSELLLYYLKYGTRGAHIPCGNALVDFTNDTLGLIWGRRDPERINLHDFAGAVIVDGSSNKSYADTDVHWSIMRSNDKIEKISFKDVEELWAARWGLKFKRTLLKGVTVG